MKVAIAIRYIKRLDRSLDNIRKEVEELRKLEVECSAAGMYSLQGRAKLVADTLECMIKQLETR